jgi:chorismate mutase/prephenate dehydratase
MDKIAVLGPKGTFTDEAAESYFNKGKVAYLPTITDVFLAVDQDKADYGVVPIENSTEGSVSETIDCLMKYDLKIYAEIYYQIRHVLAGTGKLSQLKKIRSHPMAIKQCMSKLKLGKKAKIITKLTNGQDYSTAGAMASIARLKDPTVAAIGSRKAAEKYGLNILVDNLSDREDNETRFFVISKKEAKKTGKNKTGIITAVKDEAGALYSLLKVFAEENINLTKIESRPSKRKKWEYMFLIDIEGHQDDKKIEKVLEHVKKTGTFYKLLGSYSQG